MIHSVSHTNSRYNLLFYIVFCFGRFEKWGRSDGRTDGRTTYAKTAITTGRDCGLAEWINLSMIHSACPTSNPCYFH